jgi:hypothetical protein
MIPNSEFPKKLTYRDAFYFPVATHEARRDIIIGGFLVLFLIIGWVLNLGNRLNVVSRLYKGQKPYFNGFHPWMFTFKRGCVSFLTIILYLFPFVMSALATWKISLQMPFLTVPGMLLSILLFVLAIFTLPGCMTVYAVEDRPDVLFHPLRAFLRGWQRRKQYLLAWRISLVAIILSFLGILFLGIGFFFTSVWAWEVVGYVFTVAMYTED